MEIWKTGIGKTYQAFRQRPHRMPIPNNNTTTTKKQQQQQQHQQITRNMKTDECRNSDILLKNRFV